MQLIKALTASALLASALAAPHAKPVRLSPAAVEHVKNVGPRATKHKEHKSPKLPSSPKTHPLVRIGNNDTENNDYTTNWAGAVLTSPPSGAYFNAVSATFTVPQPSLPQNAQSGDTYSASIWVGIDGDTYGAAILQTGVSISVDSYGNTAYGAWYEWYPNAETPWDSSQISINPGDQVTVSVTATSLSTGTAQVCDDTTGVCVSQDLSAPSGSSNLAGQNAEWIVEDFSSGGGLVPFCDFGTVEFSSASAGASDGSTVGITGAELINIVQNGNTLASTTYDDSADLTVTYG